MTKVFSLNTSPSFFNIEDTETLPMTKMFFKLSEKIEAVFSTHARQRTSNQQKP